MHKKIARLRELAGELKKDLSNFALSLRNRIGIGNEKLKLPTLKSSSEHKLSMCGSVWKVIDIDYVRKYNDIGIAHLVMDPISENDEDMFYTMELISREIISGFRECE